MTKKAPHLLRHVGPGLITAAVVLGPGSIVASSRAGAESEYRLVWMLIIAAVFMAAFTSMGARLGCALDVTPLAYVARRWGRPLAALTGMSAFLVVAGFQFGNNLGVSAAMAGLVGGPAWAWPIFFTALSLVFLWRAKHIYALLEKLMMLLVSTMIIAFAANLFWTGVQPVRLAAGFVPRAFEANDPMIARAMLATTFSAVAAFYQAYLVRAKGWGRGNIRNAVGDAWAGIAVLSGISLVIMMGAAGALFGTGADVANIGALSGQLAGILGPWAVIVFSLGLAAASFSSFIANALIGGALMADGLGNDARIDGMAVKLWTSAVMLTGCFVAIAVMLAGQGSSTSLLIAQGATLVAAPLCAVLLFALSSSRNVMGDLRNGRVLILLGAAGLLAIAYLNVTGFFMLLERLR